MKKSLLVSCMLIALAFVSSAQVNLYFDDFESFTAGDKVAQTAGAPWTTWSNAPGGAEDGIFSTAQSWSDSTSVYIVTNNDQVFNLYDKTTGRYKVSWYMFVETGKLGYFNLLSNFAGGSSTWAFQVMIYNDSIFVDAGAPAAVGIPYQINAWKKMDLIIDLDDDFATYYIDTVEIISYKWSTGTDGSGTLNKVDAINFYGWDGSGSPVTGLAGYYIDDLRIDSVEAPNAPSNLLALINGNDIDVSWSASTPTPDLYKLSRNNTVVNSTTSLGYSDIGPWPNTYVYGVRSHYLGEGYSHSSNLDTAVIAGGVTRNLVLMEGGTGTWCTFCPGAAMGLRDLIEVNLKDAVAVEYHSGDAYEIPASAARIAYYNITGFPTVIADGKLRVEGGSATQSLYPSYLPLYNQRIAMPAFHIFDIDVQQTAPTTYTAQIIVDQSFEAWGSGQNLFTALTESNIPFAWLNQTEVDFACRGMYPNAAGTPLDFSSSTTDTVNVTFSTSGFVKDNCEFVIWVQHPASQEVTQAAKVDMASIIGIEEISGNRINIYPNPATDYIILQTTGNGTVQIFDNRGAIVSTSPINSTEQLIDLSRFAPGIYMVRSILEGQVFTEKLIVR